MALRALLASPEFLFRIERDPASIAAEHAVSASAISSWRRGCRSSSGAASPTMSCSTRPSPVSCSEPRVLEQQVRRMLADPRSEALVNNFADQWLYLRNLTAATPDPRLFPDFDDNLRQAFRRETELFFESVKQEDRSVLDLLRADYTFVNERLAKHYGIPNVYGSHFRRVDAAGRQPAGRPAGPGEHPDRDVLWQPHVAGAARQVDSRKPPGHAAAAAAAERSAAERACGRRQGLTMRERMAQHRANPACAAATS